MSARFFVSSQCGDHLAIYDEGSRAVVLDPGDPGVGSSVVFDAATGKVFQNLTPNYGYGAAAPLVVDRSFTVTTPFAGFVVGADGVLGRLYVNANDGSFRALDSSTYVTLQASPATSYPYVAADGAHGRFYAASGATITARDANTFAPLTTITLGDSIANMRMAPGDHRIYAIGGGHLYVVQTQ